MKETFYYRIIKAVAGATHAADNIVLSQQFLKRLAGVLATLIRMMALIA